MRRCGVKRLPVVDDEGQGIGTVSRGDVLAVFAHGDDDIRSEIVDDVIAGTLLLDPTPYTVAVRDGVVGGLVAVEAPPHSCTRAPAPWPWTWTDRRRRWRRPRRWPTGCVPPARRKRASRSSGWRASARR